MREAAVFIHGIWLSGMEMALLRRRIRARGYRCHQFRYHSILQTPAENARRLDGFLAQIDADVIHLVAHSLGGIVVLHLFDLNPFQKPGRVVMLASPVAGSALARRLSRGGWLRGLLGRSTERGVLGDAPRWKGRRELGMVAGTRGFGMGKLLFGGVAHPNDGTVAVAETAREESLLRLHVPYSHFGMLFAAPVARAVANFLTSGDFSARDEEADATD